jgi:hypothetical protein
MVLALTAAVTVTVSGLVARKCSHPSELGARQAVEVPVCHKLLACNLIVAVPAVRNVTVNDAIFTLESEAFAPVRSGAASRTRYTVQFVSR